VLFYERTRKSVFILEKINYEGGNMAKKKDEKKEKKGLGTRFMTYCRGVKTEFKRVHWTTKSDLTLVFVIVFSLFFYGVNALNVLIHSLVG